MDHEQADPEDDRNYVARYDAPMIIKTDKIRFEETGNRDMVRFEMETTGGFRVYEQDKGIHLTRLKKKKEREDELKQAEIAKAQQTIPEFIDVKPDENEILPF